MHSSDLLDHFYFEEHFMLDDSLRFVFRTLSESYVVFMNSSRLLFQLKTFQICVNYASLHCRLTMHASVIFFVIFLFS